MKEKHEKWKGKKRNVEREKRKQKRGQSTEDIEKRKRKEERDTRKEERRKCLPIFVSQSAYAGKEH